MLACLASIGCVATRSCGNLSCAPFRQSTPPSQTAKSSRTGFAPNAFPDGTIFIDARRCVTEVLENRTRPQSGKAIERAALGIWRPCAHIHHAIFDDDIPPDCNHTA